MSKVKLSEIGTFKNGLNFSAENVNCGCKMIGVPDFGDNYVARLSGLKEVNTDIVTEEYLLNNNDILFVRSNGNKNLVGRTMIVTDIEENVTFSGFCIRFRITKDEVNPLYMLYLFKSPLFKKLLTRTNQTSISNLNQELLGDIEFEMPDLSEQNKIVNTIHGITNKIVLNQKINDNLQHQLKLLYDYWFSQFDFPNADGKPYFSSGGTMLVADKYPCPIPDGWKVESVFENSISNIIQPGIAHFSTKDYFATSDISGTDISGGVLIEYETRESRANMQPTVKSVWFAKMKNSIKHLYLNEQMQDFIDHSVLSTGFCGLQCSDISFEYMASFIEHSYFEMTKNVLAHGATQEAVNNDDLANISLLIPPDEILQLYHEYTQPIYAQISQNICENQELVKLRDWLLPMLMNGQATISD